MKTPRTVTVQTIDHGPVTIPEPEWCRGEHPAGWERSAIVHYGADLPASVPVPGGRAGTAAASLVQRPFDDDTRTLVEVELDQHYAFDAAGLDLVAAALVEHASVLRHLARELPFLQLDGAPR
ncbi:hypothetical protein [Streptomyces sp. NPDC051219]|uniref:DUF6907 domain-containing protein n=1 Tax=Streptomyces sp. NPDC051219 TaxID=3155283 RepID=UPI003431A4C0